MTTLRKYNTKIAPTKAVWIHVGGGEVPGTLTVGECIARVQRVTYLGSVLDENGDPSSDARANAQRVKQTFTKKFRRS